MVLLRQEGALDSVGRELGGVVGFRVCSGGRVDGIC